MSIADGFAKLPPPPHYALIFSSRRNDDAAAGYDETSSRMVELARQQPGFVGVQSARDAAGFGITVAYWDSEAAINAWHLRGAHRGARARSPRLVPGLRDPCRQSRARLRLVRGMNWRKDAADER